MLSLNFFPVSWNSAKIYSAGLSTTECNVFNLPLCGIPITIYSTLLSAAISQNASNPEIKESQPSDPNRFEVLK